jgi:hypothetical protein
MMRIQTMMMFLALTASAIGCGHDKPANDPSTTAGVANPDGTSSTAPDASGMGPSDGAHSGGSGNESSSPLGGGH